MRAQTSYGRFLGTFTHAAAHGPLPAGGWVLARAELYRRRALRLLGMRRRPLPGQRQNETL
jgi:hypothetical protein